MPRILTALTINELSAVDYPAQVHAKMTILKRDDARGAGAAHKAAPPTRPVERRSEPVAKHDRHERPAVMTESQTIQKIRDGRAAQRAIQADVDALAKWNQIGKADAIRLLRQTRPELFGA